MTAQEYIERQIGSLAITIASLREENDRLRATDEIQKRTIAELESELAELIPDRKLHVR